MILVVLVALVASAAALPNTRIVGGSEAARNSHPHIASLQRLSFGIIWSHSCGASLIDTNWALTAAHCVDGASTSSVRLNFGEHSLSATDTGEQSRGVSRIIMHPNWDANGSGFPNDVALLELSSAVSETSQVQVIPRAQSGSSYDEQTVTIAGWGRTTGGGSLPDLLQEVDMTALTVADCQNRWGSVSVLSSHICVFDYNGQASACNGDSGGPMLAASGELIGVTSWGRTGCDPEYPSVYARVSSYQSWIDGYVN